MLLHFLESYISSTIQYVHFGGGGQFLSLNQMSSVLIRAVVRTSGLSLYC